MQKRMRACIFDRNLEIVEPSSESENRDRAFQKKVRRDDRQTIPTMQVHVSVTDIDGVWVLGDNKWRFQESFFTLSARRNSRRIAYLVGDEIYSVIANLEYESGAVFTDKATKVSAKQRNALLKLKEEALDEDRKKGLTTTEVVDVFRHSKSREARRAGRAIQPVAH